jgi:hypothetical protein
MSNKPFWASKTLWVNALAVAAAVGTVVGFDLTPELQAEIVVIVMGVVNIVLRFVTKSGVSVSGD